MDKLKKVQNYLNEKEGSYTVLDKIFSFYASGEFNVFLKNHNVSGIEFFPSIKNDNTSLQVYFNHGNLSVVLESSEDYCDYSVYKPGCSPEEMEKSIKREQYAGDFDIKVFLELLFQSNGLDEDVEVVKDINTERKKKKRLYNIIAFGSMLLPFIILGILALCGQLEKLNGKAWYAVFMAVCLVVAIVFDIKATKIRK